MLEFQQKYIEDAGELITQLESQLIDFEHDTTNEAIIQELFRVMHTLKGTSGMFGFKKIEEFTHALEDIYSLIRSKQLNVNQEILNLTFDSVDLIKLLLYNRENIDSEQEEMYVNLVNLTRKYTSKPPLNIVNEQPVKIAESGNQKQTLYCILFKPEPNILLRGIKPNSILDELTGLGKNVVFSFVNEKIEFVENESYNQYFEVFLSGNVDLEAIQDVFLFLDESEYRISALNDTSNSRLEFFLLNTESVNNNIELEELITRINEILDVTPKHESDESAENKNETQKEDLKEEKTPEKIQKVVQSGNYEESIRVSARKLDDLLNLVSELILVQSQFENHSVRLQDEALTKTVKELSKLSRNFRDEILSTRLIPIAVLATGIQRLVRDLSLKLGKEVELITEGLHTELDKNIISRIENPLMHIIRNCLDHGIESPETRILNSKKALGRIRFIAFYSGASVFIQIQDDGRGIVPEKVFEKAVSKGIVKYDAVLTTKQIYDILFLPGFSTASEVTEVSGRGVGLDAVKKVITDLHGELNIDSEIGLGTSFTIKLPLTLSIIDALFVICDKYKILIPTNNILFCKYIPASYFNTKEMQYEFDKKCVPVKRLSEIFSPESNDIKEFEVLIILSIYEKYYGLLVNRIVSSLQAVIKPLGDMHREQPYFIGASQLGDGTIAYVLDTNFLLKINS